MFSLANRGFAALALLLVTFCPRAWAGGEDWMKSIDGEKYLYELTIPGTHDSGAMIDGAWPDTARCQNKTIEEQLNFGIRFLDIRCRHINNAFVIHHGPVYQKLNFDDVMRVVSSWLQAHPSETIIMSLKEEHKPEGNTRTFGQTFGEYAKNYPVFYFGKDVPQFKDVRGKVVLLRRFNEAPLPDAEHRGINADNRGWPHDGEASLTPPGPAIFVQDMFAVFYHSRKWDKIKRYLDEAKTQNPKTLYLNFASGYDEKDFGIPRIRHLADSINPRLKNYFQDTNHGKGRYGVVIMDFAYAELTKLIYEKNITSGPAASLVPEARGVEADAAGYPETSAPADGTGRQSAPAPAAVRSSASPVYERAPLVQIPGGDYKFSPNQPSPRRVTTYWIGRYEVTWSHFQAVRDWAVTHGYGDLATRGAGSGPLHPVRNVNWYDAVKWCNALSEREGLAPVYMLAGQVYRTGESGSIQVNRSVNGYRLPTQTEREVAARGGHASQNFWCSGGNEPDKVAWYLDNSGGAEVALTPSGQGTWPVGLKAANELGIYDMSGNVAEWCEENAATYVGPIAIKDVRRTTCGGSWKSAGDRYGPPGELGDLHVLAAENPVPSFRSTCIGIRVVRGP